VTPAPKKGPAPPPFKSGKKTAALQSKEKKAVPVEIRKEGIGLADFPVLWEWYMGGDYERTQEQSRRGRTEKKHSFVIGRKGEFFLQVLKQKRKKLLHQSEGEGFWEEKKVGVTSAGGGKRPRPRIGIQWEPEKGWKDEQKSNLCDKEERGGVRIT